MDLGSAVLSAELALELLDDDVRGRVVLCPAPLVEGLIVAAVAAAAGGAGRDEVAAEAVGGARRQAVASRGGRGASPDPTRLSARSVRDATAGPGPRRRRTPARRPRLHRDQPARPARAARARRGAGRSQALTRGSRCATARPVRLGARVQPVQGGHAGRAAATRSRSASPAARPARRWTTCSPSPRAASTRPTDGSTPPPRAPPPRPASSTRAPIAAPPPASASARRWSLRDADGRTSPTRTTDDPGERLAPPARGARRRPPRRAARPRRGPPRDRRGRSRDLRRAPAAARRRRPARRRARAGRRRAGRGARLGGGARRVEADLAALPDPYLQARAADVRAVGDQVLRGAARRRRPGPSAGDGVLVAADLTPAEAAELDPGARSGGGPGRRQPHRAQHDPGAGTRDPGGGRGGRGCARRSATGTLVGGRRRDAARSWSTRAEDVLDRFRAPRAPSGAAHERRAAPGPPRPPSPATASRSWSGPTSARSTTPSAADGDGADLAGLVRTEFLFLGRARPPTSTSRRRSTGDRRGARRPALIMRTLDVGGDKPLPYLPMPPEANPFLGVRGHPARAGPAGAAAPTSLAAIRRAVARGAPISVMFPMIAHRGGAAGRPGACSRTRSGGRARRPPGSGGDHGRGAGRRRSRPRRSRRDVDFFSHRHQRPHPVRPGRRARQRRGRRRSATRSIPGCSRLDRGVPRRAGERAVAVCGELAADERAAALLVGLGVRELSVAPAAVPHGQAGGAATSTSPPPKSLPDKPSPRRTPRPSAGC